MVLTYLTIGSTTKMLKTTATQRAQNYSFSHSSDKVMDKYIRNIRAINKATAYKYHFRLTTFQNFIKYHDVDMSPRKSKLRVKIPKVMRKSKEALSKEDITDILNVCSDIRLKHILCY